MRVEAARGVMRRVRVEGVCMRHPMYACVEGAHREGAWAWVSRGPAYTSRVHVEGVGVLASCVHKRGRGVEASCVGIEGEASSTR
jgi:hypothetical protein